jgi:LAS superfamily LD-carboxypeptidase LdcB
MGGFRTPGPRCQVRDWFDDSIDPGTTALVRHLPPGHFGAPAGRIPISERTDPGLDSLERVDKYGMPHLSHEQGRVFYLNRSAAESLRALRAAAAEAGLDTTTVFTLTSAHRSSDRQATLAAAARERYGNEERARVFVAQGHSEHITGRAVDLNLGIQNSGDNATARAFDALPAYRWLNANAHRFGLNPYPYASPSHPGEPWHWSYNVRER